MLNTDGFKKEYFMPVVYDTTRIFPVAKETTIAK